MDELLQGLRAVAETTRLRLLLLCAASELTVTELTEILGQSQPRVSRHLKLLCDAGLLERFREGSWVFYRSADHGEPAVLARGLMAMVRPDDPVAGLDRERLAAVKRHRAERAAAYFRANAENWDRIRSLYIDEREVERALAALLPQGGMGELLDIGTGTGRMLEVFAPQAQHALGIDLSREMLAVARANIARSGLSNCAVRQADMYQLPLPTHSVDAVIIHQVLHYADRPGSALAEAARVLGPGGRLVTVDFAPHALEFLREQHAHRRLGFADEEVTQWYREAGLAPEPPVRLPGEPLTVVLWPAHAAVAMRPAAARKG